jgi:hypothetical protein
MFKGIKYILKKNQKNIWRIKFHQQHFSTEVNPAKSDNVKREEILHNLKRKYIDFKNKLIYVIQEQKKEDSILLDDKIDELIKMTTEMTIETLTDEDIKYMVKLIKPRLSKRKPMRISTFINVLKFFSDFKVRDEKIMRKCEKLTLLRRNELSSLGKEDLINIYNVFTNFKNKNYIFWEEIDKIILSVFEDLSFEEKSKLYQLQSMSIENEQQYLQKRNSILYKKLSGLTDNFMVKKLDNEQFTILLHSLMLQQTTQNINNTIIINNFYHHFPVAIKTMTYRQGVICMLSLLKANFIIAESEVMKNFVEYIVKNAKFPCLAADIPLLLLGSNYKNYTEWGEDLLKKMIEKLAIRRDPDLFLEDLSLYAKQYEKSPEKIDKFIMESSAFCRINGLKRGVQIEESVEDESLKEGFYKGLNLNEIYVEYVDGTNYNKI